MEKRYRENIQHVGLIDRLQIDHDLDHLGPPLPLCVQGLYTTESTRRHVLDRADSTSPTRHRSCRSHRSGAMFAVEELQITQIRSNTVGICLRCVKRLLTQAFLPPRFKQVTMQTLAHRKLCQILPNKTDRNQQKN